MVQSHNSTTTFSLQIQNALNIVPLNSGVTEVKKVGYNGFAVGLMGKDKIFRYIYNYSLLLSSRINVLLIFWGNLAFEQLVMRRKQLSSLGMNGAR